MLYAPKEQQKKFESLLKRTPSKSIMKKVGFFDRVLEEANNETRGELKSTGNRKAPKESLSRPGEMQPVKKKKKRTKTQLSLEKDKIPLHSQKKSLISENKPLSERVSEMEQLLQGIKAVQEKMKFERDFS